MFLRKPEKIKKIILMQILDKSVYKQLELDPKGFSYAWNGSKLVIEKVPSLSL